MKFVQAIDQERSVLEEFFEDKWDNISDKQRIHQHGFFVDYQDEYKAFFALTPAGKSGVWLKNFYMKEGVPASLPLTIIESSVALAKEKGASHLYVFSHQQSLDSLLGLMQFQAVESPEFAEKQSLPPGTWWKITV